MHLGDIKMGNIKVGNNEISVGAILIVVGALAALISLFLSYVNYEYFAIFEWKTISMSGANVITGTLELPGNAGEKIAWSFIHFAPLIVVITAIVGAIMAFVPMFAKISNMKTYNIIVTVIMAISVIFAIIFVAMGAGAGLFGGEYADLAKTALENETIKMSLGAGAFIGLIGAIVGLVGAGISLKESL